MPRIIVDFEWEDDETRAACVDEWAEEPNDLLVEELESVLADFGIRPDRILYDD